MITRHWKATAKPDQVESYLQHLRGETFPALARIPGFRRAVVMSKPGASGVDLLVMTEWESQAAISAFAGDDPGVAVVPAVVQSMMVRFDQRVDHYVVIDEHPPAADRA
jgi:heme-degrading monooxygenase HmoA